MKFTLRFLFSETDLVPGIAAFVACLVLPLELGILVGIGLNVLFILYHAARPKIRIEFLSVGVYPFSKSFDINTDVDPISDVQQQQIFNANARSLPYLPISGLR